MKRKEEGVPMQADVRGFRSLLIHHRASHEKQGWDVDAMVAKQDALLEQGITAVDLDHDSQRIIWKEPA
jgi:hypothetical protein